MIRDRHGRDAKRQVDKKKITMEESTNIFIKQINNWEFLARFLRSSHNLASFCLLSMEVINPTITTFKRSWWDLIMVSSVNTCPYKTSSCSCMIRAFSNRGTFQQICSYSIRPRPRHGSISTTVYMFGIYHANERTCSIRTRIHLELTMIQILVMDPWKSSLSVQWPQYFMVRKGEVEWALEKGFKTF